MSFFKGLAKVAKAIERDAERARKERARAERAAAKEEILAKKKADKDAIKSAKLFEGTVKKLLEDKKEEHRMIMIKLTIDREYDWNGEHIF
jgi:hypothetical protein